jgi:hypothetical protein
MSLNYRRFLRWLSLKFYRGLNGYTRIDCESKATHNLIQLLDKPGEDCWESIRSKDVAWNRQEAWMRRPTSFSSGERMPSPGERLKKHELNHWIKLRPPV